MNMSTLYIYLFTSMHVYCVPLAEKRPDIVEEILMPCGHWNQRCLESGAKFTQWMSQNLNSIFFLCIDLTYMFCTNIFFLICTN